MDCVEQHGGEGRCGKSAKAVEDGAEGSCQADEDGVWQKEREDSERQRDMLVVRSHFRKVHGDDGGYGRSDDDDGREDERLQGDGLGGEGFGLLLLALLELFRDHGDERGVEGAFAEEHAEHVRDGERGVEGGLRAFGGAPVRRACDVPSKSEDTAGKNADHVDQNLGRH